MSADAARRLLPADAVLGDLLHAAGVSGCWTLSCERTVQTPRGAIGQSTRQTVLKNLRPLP